MLSFPLSAWCVPCVGVRRAATTAPAAPDKCAAPVCCNLDAVRRSSDAERALLGDDDDDDGSAARGRLAGPQLWGRYSARVHARMQNPTHRGAISRAEAARRGCALVVGEHGAEACGDAVRLYLAVDRRTGRVADARFRTFGCATAIAASDAAAELCVGRTLPELRALTNARVEAALRDRPDVPAIPPQKMHCSVMAAEVVRSALRDAQAQGLLPSPATTASSSSLQGKPGSSSKGKGSSDSYDDDHVVCACAGVTVGMVRDAIRTNGLRTVAQIRQYTKAGAFCGSCTRAGGHAPRDVYLVDILRAELARSKAPAPLREPAVTRSSTAAPGAPGVPPSPQPCATEPPFRALTAVQQAARVQHVLDAWVAPVLRGHGGRVVLRDFRAQPVPTVELQYAGACAACALASGATLRFITQTLREQLAEPTLLVVLSGTDPVPSPSPSPSK